MIKWWKEQLEGLPFDKITVKELRSLDYGEDRPLGDKWVLSKHSEEDCIDIRLSWEHEENEACGEYLYSVCWNHETDLDDSIEYDQCFDENQTPMEYSEKFSGQYKLADLKVDFDWDIDLKTVRRLLHKNNYVYRDVERISSNDRVYTDKRWVKAN